MMNLSFKKLTKLENLPNDLQLLNCYGNELTKLENLPQSLIVLDITDNKLTRLENLPPLLQELYCQGNELTKLENLPVGLIIVTHIDNVMLSKINFTLKGYNSIRRIQKRLKQRINLRLIQKELHDWLWKPPYGLVVQHSFNLFHKN